MKVVSIRDRLSTLLEEKFAIIFIYDRHVTLCYTSVTVTTGMLLFKFFPLLMYIALSVEVPAGRSIAVLCPLSGTGPVCPMIHKCLSLGQGLWFITCNHRSLVRYCSSLTKILVVLVLAISHQCVS